MLECVSSQRRRRQSGVLIHRLHVVGIPTLLSSSVYSNSGTAEPSRNQLFFANEKVTMKKAKDHQSTAEREQEQPASWEEEPRRTSAAAASRACEVSAPSPSPCTVRSQALVECP